MISERKLMANRRNAARSTGPRTRSGQARSSRNALLHGFAAERADYHLDLPEVQRLTRLILGDRTSSSARYYSREAAFAELHILNIRAQRVLLLGSILRRSSQSSPQSDGLLPRKKREVNLDRIKWERLAEPVIKRRRLARRIARQLHKDRKASNTFAGTPDAYEAVAKAILNLDRYERRAMTRRDRAFRELEIFREPITSSASL